MLILRLMSPLQPVLPEQEVAEILRARLGGGCQCSFDCHRSLYRDRGFTLADGVTRLANDPLAEEYLDAVAAGQQKAASLFDRVSTIPYQEDVRTD
ncbi:MAG: hypothetical protein U5L11_03580 [Arhodomonas sp.]|nr:hypothetical protein [Arhodomonas sp.]